MFFSSIYLSLGINEVTQSQLFAVAVQSSHARMQKTCGRGTRSAVVGFTRVGADYSGDWNVRRRSSSSSGMQDALTPVTPGEFDDLPVCTRLQRCLVANNNYIASRYACSTSSTIIYIYIYNIISLRCRQQVITV